MEKNFGFIFIRNDILNCDDILIDNYLKTKLNMKERTVYFDGGENEKEEINN